MNTLSEKWNILRRFLVATSIVTILLIAFSYLLIKWAGHNTNYFTLNNGFEIKLTTTQCMTCFIDWEIEFNLEILKVNSVNKKEFKFYSTCGPKVIFTALNDNEILIQGYEQYSELKRIINFKKNTISFNPDIQVKDSKKHYKLTSEFEIKEIYPLP